MPDNLKMFERLAYGALVLGLLSDFLARKATMFEAILYVVVTLVVAALVFVAARKGQSWAAWIVGIVAVLALVATIGDFWVGGPDWLQDVLRPETPPTMLQKVLDVAATAMFFAALYFYFFAGTRRTAPAA